MTIRPLAKFSRNALLTGLFGAATLLPALAAAQLTPSGALAIADDEDANDAFGTAGIQIVRGGADPGIYVGAFSLIPGDLDFIGLGPLAAGEVITAMTTPVEDGLLEIPDTVLGVFDSAGVRLVFNDDANGSGSALRFVVPTSGDYFVGVSGFGDDAFEGAHSESGSYVFVISVPAGATSIFDDESANDAIGTAGIQVLRGSEPDAYVGSFNLIAGDIDFLGLGPLAVDDVISVTTTPIEDGLFQVPDTILGIFDAGGALLDFNDDDEALGFGSTVRYRVPSSGPYFIAVSGFGDSLFEGQHDKAGDYTFTVGLTPSAATPEPTPTSTPSPTPSATPTPDTCLQALSPCQRRNQCCSNICSGRGQNKVCEAAPTATPTPTATPSATPTPTPTPTATPTATPAPNYPTKISLIWADTGTNEIDNLDPASVITLRVILTSGPLGSEGAQVSVDYADVVGTLVVTNHTSTPGGPLPITSGTTTDTGSRIEGINALAFPPFEGTGLTGSNQSYQLGTVTFSTSQLPSGILEIRPDANGLGDVILDLYGNDITSMTTFNSAFLCAGQGSCLNPTPTPTATPIPSPTATPTATPTPTPPLGVPAASDAGRALLGLFAAIAGAVAIARRRRGAGAAR